MTRERSQSLRAVLSAGTAAFLSIMTAACAQSSEWDNLEVRAAYSINGKPHTASTVWRTSIRDTFPTGSTERIEGNALVIEVAPRQYVLGTFAEHVLNQAREGSISTVIDSYVFGEHQRLGSGPVPRTKAGERNAAIKEAIGKRVPICNHLADDRMQPPCLLFDRFNNPDNPRSMQRVDVGAHFDVADRNVVIKSVTIGFVDKRPLALSIFPSMLWLQQPRGTFIRELSTNEGLKLPFPLHVIDFKRP